MPTTPQEAAGGVNKVTKRLGAAIRKAMLKVKPEYLSKRGKREFVVLTVEDFDRMKEALEDAEDLRALRKAAASNAKAPYYTPGEVERRLRASPTRKKKAG